MEKIVIGDWRHCGYRECVCTHTQDCVAGWRDGHKRVVRKTTSKGEVIEKVYDVTLPCPICRTELFHILKDSKSPQEAQRNMQARSMHSRIVAKADEQRSRTL